jgi:hypothetical protein
MRWKYLLLIGISFSLLAGCDEAVKLADDISRESFAVVTDAGDFLFELISSEDLHIKDVTANVENQRLVIKGEIARSVLVQGRIKRGLQNCCEVVTGHIDIAAFDSDGFLVESFSILFSPRAIPKGGTKSSSFEARISKKLPENSTIKVAYHDSNIYVDSDATKAKRDCGENTALLSDTEQDIKPAEVEL